MTFQFGLKSISLAFYEQLLCRYSLAKKFQSQNVSRGKLRKLLLYKKVFSKMLMKLTPDYRLKQIFGNVTASHKTFDTA